jgi:nucleotidyltransferase/DNA polymerase involved in DNA repair
MALREAEEKATEETVFLEADHDYYRRKSEEVMSILSSFTSKIQQTSIDEAYFRLEGDEIQKAKKIKAGVESLGLTASIGIAPNKFLAKLASEDDKPDGLRKVGKDHKKSFLDGREIIDIHGVGSKTEQKLMELGIEKVDDLRDANNSILVQEFGREKTASLKRKAVGKGSHKLEADSQKQISKIKTMERNSRSHRYVMKEIEELGKKLHERINSKQKAFRKVTLIGIDTELNQYTRSKKIDTTETQKELLNHADSLLRKLLDQNSVQFRRIGLRVSDLVDRKTQMTLQKF